MEVARIFQESQASGAGHRKLVAQMKRELENSVDNDSLTLFIDAFCQAAVRLLPIKKSEPNADHVVKFIGAFVNHISPENEDESEATPEYVYTFIETTIGYFTRSLTAKDKVVRYRGWQLVTTILQNSTIMSDDISDNLRKIAQDRCRDRDHSVRIQVVLTLVSLVNEQDNEVYEEVVKLLVDLMEHDTNPEVRRAALLNVPKRKRLYPKLVERSLDVNSVNRRNVYSRVMREIEDFRLLKLGQREKLLSNGLTDRSASVRNAATNMLLSQWLRTVDNDVIKLLGRLDVLNSQVAQQVLEALFKARPDVVRERIGFGQDFWEGLSPEGAFLVRCWNEYCRKNNLVTLVEKKLPELSEYADLLMMFWRNYCQAGEDEKAEHDFIVEQLLTVASTYDFSDEFGRQKLLQVLDTILSASHAPSDVVIAKAVQVLRNALTLVSDFMLKIEDILDDLDGPSNREEDPDISMQLTNVFLQYSIIDATLRCLKLPYDDIATLNSLYDRIHPALQSTDYEIITRGLNCLGLLCLLSKAQTDAHLEELLAMYNPDATEYEGDGEINEIVIQAASDALLTQRIYPETAKRARDIVAHGFRQTEIDAIRTVSAKALAKLFLSNLLNTEPELLGELVKAYFSSAEFAELEQILSFFVPVYALTSSENQKRIASQFNVIIESYQEDTLDVPIPTVLAQLVEWTSPQRSEDAASTVHGDLAISMLSAAKDSPVELQNAILSAAGKLTLIITPEQADKIMELIGGLQEEVNRVGRTALSAFERHFEKTATSRPNNQPILEIPAAEEPGSQVLSHVASVAIQP